MEVALVSAATGALKPVLGKLTALLGDEYKRLGLRKEIYLLTDELAAMHNFLLKMSEVEDPDLQDKAWMNEVRELSYDMEDSIDEFMRREDIKPDSLMEKITYLLGKMKARHRIGSEIEDLKKKVTLVGQRNARYKTGVSITNTNNADLDPRALAIFEQVSNLVGIDEPKNEIIKLLTQEDEFTLTQQQLKVVSIVGFGGMGKTTLANQVYRELKLQFECCVFISVSRNPDLMNILRTILSEVSNQRYADTEAGSIQQLINKIAIFLVGKRYFIVVDDVWNVKTWDVIKCAFPMTSHGSRIITTTRIIDVADSCCSSFTGHVYNMRPLNSAHSRQLFNKRLFNSEENCHLHLKDVSDQILKKCGGLPLAIIAISGLLSNKERTEYTWNQVKDSISHSLESNSAIEGMRKILSLSYFDLPPHLKTCLLYVSVFPEDHSIEKKGLIRRWIAEGFICKEDRYSVHELGERCFNELVNRSLIQPGEPDIYNKVESCRIHDIILDFIISKSIEENFVTLLGVPNLIIGTERKVRRISLQVGKQGNSTLPKSAILSHVRSLNVFGDLRDIPSLDKFSHLRVLDFGGCYHLENRHLVNIGRLFQLRYLNLRNTKVAELPEQIGYLHCIEIMDLRDTNIHELPASIVNLGKLVHLFIDIEVKFPDGVAKMKALDILKQVSVYDQSFNFLQGLGELKNLRKLHLDFQHCSTGGTSRVKECMKAIASSLSKLGRHNLRSLTIVDDDCFLLEPLRAAPLSLEKLMFWQSVVLQVPSWVSSLVNLQQLRLEVEGVSQEDLCILGGLPALTILDLEGTAKSKERLRIYGGVGFQCLRMFCYFIPGEGMDLMFAQGSMPNLEILEIYFNADDTESLTSDSFDFRITNLPCLKIVKCGVCYRVESTVEAVKAAMKKAASAHPNHPNLLFKIYG